MKISIITVVWNNDKTIKKAIESVLNQSYKEIEYIIVDGQSSDKTVNIINSYGEKISKFISEPDNGLYDAMNKGITLATGDVIGILNSDDFYENNSIIQNIIDEFQSRKVDIIYGDVVYVNPDNLEKIVRYYDSSKFNPLKFAYGWMPAHPSVFVKRHIYEKYGLFRTDLKIASDFDILARLIYVNNVSYGYINKVVVRMRTGGISSSFSNIFLIIKEQLKVCSDNHIDTNPLKICSKYFTKLPGFLKR